MPLIDKIFSPQSPRTESPHAMSWSVCTVPVPPALSIHEGHQRWQLSVSHSPAASNRTPWLLSPVSSLADTSSPSPSLVLLRLVSPGIQSAASPSPTVTSPLRALYSLLPVYLFRSPPPPLIRLSLPVRLWQSRQESTGVAARIRLLWCSAPATKQMMRPTRKGTGSSQVLDKQHPNRKNSEAWLKIFKDMLRELTPI